MNSESRAKLFPPCLEPPYFAPDGTLGWDQDTGKPDVMFFGDAVQVWSLLQNRTDVTLEQAAASFNVPIEMVRQAVEEHPWLLLEGKDGNVIGHEGE